MRCWKKWKRLQPAAPNSILIMLIDEMLDEYDQEEIIEYFKGCETSSLQVAQEELSEHNFTWEQLKIMRIKFLGQYGN